MSDRGTDRQKRLEPSSSSSSSSRSVKKSRRSSGQEAVPIVVPSKNAPQIASTHINRRRQPAPGLRDSSVIFSSRQREHSTFLTSRPRNSAISQATRSGGSGSSFQTLRSRDNSTLQDKQPEAHRGHITLPPKLASSSKANPILIDDHATCSQSSTSRPVKEYHVSTESKPLEMRGNIHKVFARKPAFLEGLSDDDDETDRMRKRKDRESLSDDEGAVSHIGKRRARRLSSTKESVEVIHIDSDEEEKGHPSKAKKSPSPSRTFAPEQHRIMKYLDKIKSMDTSSTIPRPKLVDGLRNSIASETARPYSKSDPKGRQFKNQESSTVSKSVQANAFDLNLLKTQPLDLKVGLPSKHRSSAESSSKSDIWRMTRDTPASRTPISDSLGTSKASTSLFSHKPKLALASKNSFKPKPAPTPLASYLPKATKKDVKEKETIEIADDSSDDGDFQSAPNSPVMADSPPEPKAASPKKNKESSAFKNPFSSQTPSTSTSKVSDFISGSTTGSFLKRLSKSLERISAGIPIEQPKKEIPPSVPIDPEKEALTYPFNGKQAITIKESDIERVENDKFLNDTVMDAYPKILQAQHQRNSIYVFSSFFFTRLTQSDESSPRKQTTAIKYEKVQRWTDKVNIFEKKYIVIPIEQAHHWFTAIITNPAHCVGLGRDDEKSYVTILDSLGGDRKVVYEQVCKYLKAEATTRLDIDHKDFKAPEYVKACVPQQPNLTDCGVYCLYYLKRLFEDPKKVEQALISSDSKNDDAWIPGQVQFFRRSLTNIFKEKAKEYEAYKKEKLMKK